MIIKSETEINRMLALAKETHAEMRAGSRPGYVESYVIGVKAALEWVSSSIGEPLSKLPLQRDGEG